MTDLEKQIMQKTEIENAVNIRRGRREEVPVVEANFFGASEKTKENVSTQLKDFDNKYKPVDLASMFSDTIAPQVEKKVEREVKQTFSNSPVDPYAPGDEEFVNITKLGRTAVESTYEIPVQNDELTENKFGLKINLKGKLVLMVASVVFLCLLFLAIFNTFVISGLNTDIGRLDGQIQTESELLNWIKKEYNNVTDEDKLLDRVEDGGFVPIPPENVIEYELIQEEARQAAAKNMNWFDAFCNFMAKLFGGA